MERIINFIKDIMREAPPIVIHDDADADALGAAYVMSRVTGGRIIVPKAISQHGRELQEELDFEIECGPQDLKKEKALLLDTADYQQLPGVCLGEYGVIDHHRENKLLADAAASYHRLEDSTCQLVFQILKEMGISPGEKEALALAAGILGDTIYLEKAGNKSLILLGEILEAGGVTLKKALSLMRVNRKLSREIKLKAAMEANLYYFGDRLLICTRTDPDYVYYVAMMFIELGADIALVLSREGEETIIRLVKAPGNSDDLNLLEIMKKGVGDSKIENLWGDENFVGFKGVGDDFEIVKKLFSRLCSPGKKRES